VQSLKNKLLELTVLLQSDLKNGNVLCFTEHWLKVEQFSVTNIEHFKLVSKFSIIRNEYGGSCIYVRHRVQTKEQNCMQELCKEKDFEMSTVELVDYKIVLVCIYRLPDGDFRIFLKNLEIVIQKVLLKRKRVILCGDWNINVMEDSATSRELKNLLLLYSLVNTVTSPTSITTESLSLIDVIVTNKQAYECPSMVLDLGYSDHLAQMLKLHVNGPNRGPIKIRKRQYTKGNIEEFNYLLQKELWQESRSIADVNSCFNAFMDMILYHINTAFPLKTVHSSNIRKKIELPKEYESCVKG
jgi:hypothetical protein